VTIADPASPSLLDTSSTALRAYDLAFLIQEQVTENPAYAARYFTVLVCWSLAALVS